MNLHFKKLHEDAVVPSYCYSSDSGFDLYSIEDVPVKFGGISLVHTGLAVEMVPGENDNTHYEIQIRPKSGLALNHGITVVNSPGTVDFSFRGEICVILSTNKSSCNYVAEKGKKIAQGVVCSVITPEKIIVVDELSESDRGLGGFGSTGLIAQPTNIIQHPLSTTF